MQLLLNLAADEPSGQSNGSGAKSATGVLHSLKSTKGSWKKKRIAAKRIVHHLKKGEEDKSIEINEQQKIVPKKSNSLTSADQKQESVELSGGNMTSLKERSWTTKKSSLNSTGGSGNGGHSSAQTSTLPSTSSKTPVISSLFSSNPHFDLPDVQVESSAPSLPTFTSDSFEGLGIHPIISSYLSEKLGFTKPTPIQKSSIPSLLGKDHRDAILQAQTGSGKSLAFLLPLLERLVRGYSDNKELDGKPIAGPSASPADTPQDDSQLNEVDSDDDEKDVKIKRAHPTDSAVIFQRNMGTLAIVLAPTRELARQLYSVFESLVRFKTSSSSDPAKEQSEPSTETSLKHWVVPGIITGGEKKKSEKARLRKGIHVLFCTPGRLLDHLKTTHSFDVSNLRWLILDEADHLLEMGFEPTLQEILGILGKRQNEAAMMGRRVHVFGWPARRQTILCSATIQGRVEKLCDESLVKPTFIKVNADQREDSTKKKTDSGLEKQDNRDDTGDENTKSAETSIDSKSDNQITVPSQLKQSALITPAKLRLVSLVALLRKSLSVASKSDSATSKIIVFFATGDSVDWHHYLVGQYDQMNKFKEVQDLNEEKDDAFDGIKMDMKMKDRAKDAKNKRESKAKEINMVASHTSGLSPTVLTSALLFKLHGNMSQQDRQKTLASFENTKDSKSRILFCTDVAARGLDLSHVTHIVQFDPPSDSRDYVHRIGRTARIGHHGESYLFLLPSEVDYLNILAKNFQCRLETIETGSLLPYLPKPDDDVSGSKMKLSRKDSEIAATELQMRVERYVQSQPEIQSMAVKAFTSFIRSYATHTASERSIFHVKFLHLGHIAKSFGLRSAPSHLAALKQGGDSSKHGSKSGPGASGDKKQGAPSSSGQMKRKAVLAIKDAMTSEFGDGNATKLSFKRQKKK